MGSKKKSFTPTLVFTVGNKDISCIMYDVYPDNTLLNSNIMSDRRHLLHLNYKSCYLKGEVIRCPFLVVHLARRLRLGELMQYI
jgi:hypothetical protein